MLSSRPGASSLIIECTNCHSKYQYDEDRFERKPSKKIKCAKCQTVFEIHNPAFAAPEAKPKIDIESTASRHDQTQHKKAPKPQETTEQSPIPSPGTGQSAITQKLPEGKRLSLAIIDGPDSGSVYRIEKPRVTIGRANADLTLNDTEASRQHAAIEVRDTIILLEDLGSTNGTILDGRRITEATELPDKAEFVVGGTTLMLIVTDES
jgi:pSer/pThr/pTyr-binding forkhead associated (FHA) protein